MIFIIIFNNVSKAYANHGVVLNSISFHITKGEFVFLVGSSGAGKSTIIKLITGEEKPTGGIVTVAGHVVSKLKPSQVPYLRRNLGVVFQDFRLLPQKTVYENIAFAMEVVEAPQEEIRKRVPALLEVVGLKQKAKSLPSQLSGGEQQRVGLARALANDPMIVLCDEPTGNLDQNNAIEIMNLLQQINQYGATVMVVTHALNLVDKIRERVITIEQGQVVYDDARGGNT